MEKFEALSMGGSGLGGPEAMDLAALPRPSGEHKAGALVPPAPTHPCNCSPSNMRLTVAAMPNSGSLRARCVRRAHAHMRSTRGHTPMPATRTHTCP